MGARTDTLARLQSELARLENSVATVSSRVPLGHDAVDRLLKGGLPQGVLHEVYGGDGRQHAAATGFVLGLVHRLTANARTALWVRQDFAVQEAGELSMSGFAEFGFDPRRLIVVHAANAEIALRVTADALACNALGAVVTETCGDVRVFDLAASRRLTLAAAQSRVTSLMLRFNARIQPSTAETRWIVRAAHSPPTAAWEAWGAPVLDVEIARNRHGPTGRWIMKWICDDARFGDGAVGEPISSQKSVRTSAAHSQPAVAAPFHGPHPAPRLRDANSVRRAG